MSPLRSIPFAAALAALPAAEAAAHPHIFVDTALRVVMDTTGEISGIEVTWRYDELYSLLIFEDMGLDSDYDGKLTEAELKQLQGFDMQWVDGYEGDLYLSRGAAPLKLGKPQPKQTIIRDGRIETVHFRPLAAPQPGQGEALVLRAYDPTFYTAYDLTGGVRVPEACKVEIQAADLDAAYARVEKELEGRPQETEDYPEVGDAFADTVSVRCGPAS